MNGENPLKGYWLGRQYLRGTPPNAPCLEPEKSGYNGRSWYSSRMASPDGQIKTLNLFSEWMVGLAGNHSCTGIGIRRGKKFVADGLQAQTCLPVD